MQESTLVNVDYGDRDSLGLFQQRTSQGWGTARPGADPGLRGRRVLRAPRARCPRWKTRRLTEAAQQPCSAAAFPELYQQWAGMAVELTIALNANQSPCAPA